VAAYGVLGAALVHRLPGWLPRRVIERGGVLVLSAALFVILPAALLHHPAVAASLILGWEVMLSAHSYCVDVARSGETPRFADCVFFLLVNPTVIYGERGAPGAGLALGRGGVLRIARGAVTMVGRDVALLLVGGVAFLATSRPAEGWPVAYARFGCTQLVLVVGLYCAHSGLASIQIGWMHAIGHGIPERYRYPLFARDPQDFWRRWNIWVSRWAARYLYFPVAHAVGRRRRGPAGPLVAVMLAFLGVGVLHDLGVYAYRLQDAGRWETPSLRLTLVFFVLGAVLVVWVAVARAAALRVRALTPRARRFLGVARWLVMIHLVVAVAWLALPVLRTGRFAPQIDDVTRRMTEGLSVRDAGIQSGYAGRAVGGARAHA